MLSVQQDGVASGLEGPCSDCGQVTWRRTQYFDQHTCSTVELCVTCASALVQRQQAHPLPSASQFQ